MLGTQVERAESVGRATTQRPDELAVIIIGHLARAVIELELLQRGERAVTLFRQGKPALLELVRMRETIVLRPRLSQKGQRDEDNGDHGKRSTNNECDGHIRTAESA